MTPPIAAIPHAEPSARRSLALAGLLALGHCVAFADRSLPGVAAPLLKRELHLGDAQLGLLMGPAFALLYAVGMLLTLPMARSPYRFRLLAGCIAVWGLGMVGFALARDFAGLFAARALVGLGQAAFVPLALGLIVEDAMPRWRARAIALFTAGAAIGRGTALLLGGSVLALLLHWAPAVGMTHWRLMFLVMAVPNVLLIVALLRCRERPPQSNDAVASLTQIAGWFRRHPALVLLYLYGAGGSVLVVQTIGAWAPSILNREQGLAPATAALAFGALLLVASPLGHLLAGALVDTRRRLTPAAIVAGGLLLVVPLLWSIPHAGSARLASLLMAAISLAGGCAAVAALAGLPAMLPPSLRAAAVRLFLVFITVAGVGLGPFVTGLVSDGLGQGGSRLSEALRVVCVSVALSGAAAAWLARGGWRRAAAEAAA